VASLPWLARAQKADPEPGGIARFTQRAQAILSDTTAGKGHWGALVTDAETGAVLFALNSAQYFTPASNTKLFTTAFALATLGPDFRIRTTVEATGPIDSAGRLRGDLVLVGRGDDLTNRVFPYTKQGQRDGPIEKVLVDFADQVAGRGVKQIEGDVVADDSYLPPAGSWTATERERRGASSGRVPLRMKVRDSGSRARRSCGSVPAAVVSASLRTS